MLVADVISLAQLQSEEIYDDPTWIKYINLCLDDLSAVIKLLKKKESIAVTWTSNSGVITIASDVDLKKSNEFVYVYHMKSGQPVRQLRRLPFSDNVGEGWKLTSTEIILQSITGGATGDTARVDYYLRLPNVTTTADDLETVALLPAQYHNLVVLYCLAKSQQKEEELNDKNDAYGEYIMGKNTLAIARIWEMEPHNRKFIRRARIAALIGGGGGGQQG